MLRYLLGRFLIIPPTLALMSVVVFALIQAPPGDYLTTYIAQLQATGESVDMDEVEALKLQYGLDRPIHVQYLKWTWNLLKWDLGMSLEWQRPVKDLIGERLLLTILLSAATLVFTWAVSIPIGIFSATRQYSFFDYIFTTLSFLGIGTPNFLLALVLMWAAFSVFGLSITGLFSVEYVEAPWSVGRVIDMLKHLWVPMIILGTDGTARFSRIMRANLLDELRKPYVVTARAKGVREWRLVLKYPVRLAINPLISVVGWSLPQLLSGSLIVATVLSLPTAGPMLLRALLTQDMFLAGTFVLLLGSLTLIGTLISDVLLFLVDPRIRLEEG